MSAILDNLTVGPVPLKDVLAVVGGAVVAEAWSDSRIEFGRRVYSEGRELLIGKMHWTGRQLGGHKPFSEWSAEDRGEIFPEAEEYRRCDLPHRPKVSRDEAAEALQMFVAPFKVRT